MRARVRIRGCRGALALGVALLPATARADGLSSMSRGWVFEEQGGAALFASVCAGCHQPDAKGATGAGSYPALSGNPTVASPEYLETLLLSGQKGMPPLGSLMSVRQIADVINYVRTHFGNAYSEPISPGEIAAARTRTNP